MRRSRKEGAPVPSSDALSIGGRTATTALERCDQDGAYWRVCPAPFRVDKAPLQSAHAEASSHPQWLSLASRGSQRVQARGGVIVAFAWAAAQRASAGPDWLRNSAGTGLA